MVAGLGITEAECWLLDAGYLMLDVEQSGSGNRWQMLDCQFLMTNEKNGYNPLAPFFKGECGEGELIADSRFLIAEYPQWDAIGANF
ncbi:hypothetical protein KJ656_01755 [bacterium]|nr:hypothetical protein [bacterium]